MRKPSRLMRPLPQPIRLSRLGYAGIGLFATLMVVLLWTHPVATLVVTSLLALLAWVGGKVHRARLANLAATRPEDGGICTFARSFDLRSVDSWIVRATYEELLQYFEGSGYKIAIRPEDDVVRDLHIDAEDFEDSVLSIADRTGRSLIGYESNPYYSDATTVRGVIMLLNSQPRVA
jgi:hypothetical protein